MRSVGIQIVLAGRGQHLDAARQQIIDVAQIVEFGAIVLAWRVRAHGLGAGCLPCGLCQVAGTQCHQRRQLQALRVGRLAQELRHATVTKELAAGHVGTHELTKLRDHHRTARIDRRGGVENDVGTLEIARERQQFRQQNAGGEVGGCLAQRRLCRGNGVGQFSRAKQAGGRLIGRTDESPEVFGRRGTHPRRKAIISGRRDR